jgi:hypothetical protein
MIPTSDKATLDPDAMSSEEEEKPITEEGKKLAEILTEKFFQILLDIDPDIRM